MWFELLLNLRHWVLIIEEEKEEEDFPRSLGVGKSLFFLLLRLLCLPKVFGNFETTLAEIVGIRELTFIAARSTNYRALSLSFYLTLSVIFSVFVACLVL